MTTANASEPDHTEPDHAELNRKGLRLIELHHAPDILQVINVWDVISAKVIADLEGSTALATASHSIAASYGYPDGEKNPPGADARGGWPDRRGNLAASQRRS